MKKVICLMCTMVMLVVPFSNVWAIFEYDAIPTWSETIETMAKIENKTNLELDSQGAILIDEDTGTILYTKNEHEKLRPASVTKVMTILLIMEALEKGEIALTDKVPCSARAREMGGSQIWLDETETLTVHEMLKAICVVSANDCCVAMSEFIAGSEEMFVEKMNARAQELGMNDTTFKNCHGIDEDGHLTSAHDIALMSRELSKNHPKVHEYTKIWMDSLRDGKSELVNTNKLIRFYSGCTGLKTGSTSLAMFNLSATATRNDLSLIAVVMKGSTSQNRFNDATKLLDYGFANFSNKVIVRANEKIDTISIEKAKKNTVDIVTESDFSVLLNKGDEKNIRIENVLNENISAPLEYYEVVGVQRCYLNDELIGEVNLVSSEKIESKSWHDFIIQLVTFGYRLGR